MEEAVVEVHIAPLEVRTSPFRSPVKIMSCSIGRTSGRAAARTLPIPSVERNRGDFFWIFTRRILGISALGEDSLLVVTYVITATGGHSVMFKIKVRKIGNSLGAILPSEVAARLRVREGDILSMTETADGIQLSPYDSDFEAAMSAFERGRKRYRNALRRLAK